MAHIKDDYSNILKRCRINFTNESNTSVCAFWIEKVQRIDMGFVGFDGHFLDDRQPEIKVSEWYVCTARQNKNVEKINLSKTTLTYRY